MSQMKLKQLEYFLAAAEELNFTKAAERNYVSQTAVTQQIKLLEEQIGVRLFDRSNKRVKLTAAGKVFMAEAELLQKLYEQAVVKAQIASNGFVGDLHIGLCTGLYNTDLPDMFRNFYEKYPKIHLEFQVAEPYTVMNDLKGGHYNMIVTPRFKADYYEGLESVLLGRYPIICAVNKHNGLSAKKSVSWEDLEGSDVIVAMSEEEELKDISKALGTIAAGVELRSIRKSENIESILFSLGCDMGIALLPAYFNEWLLRENRIVVLPFGKNRQIDVCATWNPQNRSSALDNLIAHIKANGWPES